jgi:peptidoglycan/xylan/chitin deacetylase (PgdA/CDA1 family)
LRAVLKQLAETAILHCGGAAITRQTLRYRALILAYHNILPPGGKPGGDASLHLPFENFVSQLKVIQRSHEVVPLSDLLDGSVSPTARLRVAITFDDAYRGAVQYGIPEIVRQGMSATIFVCPGRLGAPSFWWDRYTVEKVDDFESGFRDYALTRLAGREELVTEIAKARGWTGLAVSDHIGCATESDLQEIATMPGVTFGSHTWSHPNLSALSEAEIEDELIESGSWLNDRFSNTIPCISYPYGLFDRRVTDAASRCGYASGLAIQGGWMRPQVDSRFAIPRLNVPAGLSEAGFGCRLAGLFCS